MEIKATLNKPYTDTDRMNFIVEQNHNNGYEIRETETELQAWGQTNEEIIVKLKSLKHSENTSKAQDAIQDGYIIYKVAQFETNTQTCSDLISAMLIMQSSGITTYNWLSKDDKVVQLTVDDFASLGNLIATYKNNVWNIKYLQFKNLIEQATSVEEIENIDINYFEDLL